MCAIMLNSVKKTIATSYNKNFFKKKFTISNKKFDKDIIDYLLKNIVPFLQKNNLYRESSWIIEEYKLFKYVLKALYSFVYTPNKSNLSLRDAQVFASYLVNQSKKLKNIVDVLSNSQSNQKK